jgi:putative peptidoglycan lipid II flippase
VGMLRRPRLGLRDPWVGKAFRLLVPLLAGLGVYQVNVMLSRLFASFLPEGSQSFLYYGQRVVEIPQGMFAYAIATATLPSLSEQKSRGDVAQVKTTFAHGLRLSLFVAIPSAVALVLLATPTVTVLFGRGAFGAGHVSETARALTWQAAGIWAVASVRTIVPMFHAYNDTKSPVICSAVNLAVFVALSLGLMGPLRHVGIAVAFSAAAVAQLLTLLLLLRRKAGPLGLRAVVVSAGRMAVAATAMGAAGWGCASLVDWRGGGNDAGTILAYLGTVVVGAIVYLTAARLLGCEEITELLGALKRRRRS